MPRMEIDAMDILNFEKKQRDLYFSEKRDFARHHRGCGRLWYFVFFPDDEDQYTCQGMTLAMVLDQIDMIQAYFNNDSRGGYMLMCPGLRSQLDSRRRSPRAPQARGTCSICHRRGAVFADCLDCGEDSGGQFFPIIPMRASESP